MTDNARISILPGLVLALSASCWGQAPAAGLQYLQTIGVPGWTTSGSTQANFDLFAFNPETHVMYVADRTNHSVDAIDTHTNVVIGVMPIPSGGSTNGVVVALDLQQLIVTDGRAAVFVYDLRLPGNGPDTYQIPGIKSGTDALDYDPFNHTVYVINGSAPYFITGIDLVNKTIASQLALPGSPELMHFNPVDGLIYQVITDGDNNNQNAGIVAYDPVANNLRATYLTPGCVPHGIDIDPVANTALLGCGGSQAQVLMDLKNGSILKTFPDVTGTDLLMFDPNNRRFYVGASGNQSTTTGCSADTTKAFPIIGVIDSKGPVGAGEGRLDGVQCAGRNSHGLGVDPIQNFVYVGARQYPVDPSNPDTGQSGVLVFWDPAPNAQAPTTQTRASLAAAGGGGPQGTVLMRLRGRSIHADASVQGVSGTTALVNVTTTVGNEVVGCGIDPTSGSAVCDGELLGDPLVGGTATLAVDGAPVAQGLITAVSGS